MKTSFPLLALLSLAACQPAQTPAENIADSARAQAQIEAPSPDGLANGAVVSIDHDAARPSTPVTDASGTTIPATFQGRWGLVEKDCGPDASIAKGLIAIDSAGIKFYESRGVLQSVTTNRPRELSGRFAFSGEGQTWSKVETLSLGADSKTLTRSDDEGRFTYHRCG